MKEQGITLNVNVNGIDEALEKAKEIQTILENCEKLSENLPNELNINEKIKGITLTLKG